MALDAGAKRVGVAGAHLDAKLASPLTTLTNPATFLSDIIGLAEAQQADWIVIGLPRGLDGQETAQTAWVRQFAGELRQELVRRGKTLPLYAIDEALTSVKAEAELAARRGIHAKSEVDALAATYILEDYLNSRARVEL